MEREIGPHTRCPPTSPASDRANRRRGAPNLVPKWPTAAIIIAMRVSKIVVVWSLVCPLAAWRAHAVTIVPTFVDASDQSWTDPEKTIITQAIGDWQNRVLDNQTINVSFDFTHVGGLGTPGSYLAEWDGNINAFPDANLYPWSAGVTQVVHFNEDLMDPTLPNHLEFTTGTVMPTNWDALSVIRHELGHMMGFTQGFYFNDFSGPNQTDKWTSHISGTTFDPGGLNVQMNNATDLSHLAESGATAGDLMTPSLTNGERRHISGTDLKMLEVAYRYAMIPGDADRDGKVDFTDLVTVARDYGQSNATWDTGDFNNDGSVGFDDLVTLARHYGQTLDTAPFGTPTAAQLAQLTPALRADIEAAFAQVPEPATAGLLGMASVVLLRRRRLAHGA